MFEKIKKWYMQGLWTEQMVLMTVKKGILAAAEANEIINENRE